MYVEEALFRRVVPIRLQRAIMRAVFDGCIHAHERVRGVDRDFSVDALPTLRRVAVEPILAKLVLPRGFDSEIVKTPSTSYTRISSSDVVITAVTRTRSVKWVAPYRYRGTLARSAQLMLPLLGEAPPAGDDARLYALLMYGGAHKAEMPTMARFVFPLESGDLLPYVIDLIKEHPDIAEGYVRKATGIRKANAKLRNKAKDGTKDGAG